LTPKGGGRRSGEREVGEGGEGKEGWGKEGGRQVYVKSHAVLVSADVKSGVSADRRCVG